MGVYLVRHGKALSKEVDPERGLSEEGRAELERVGRFLQGCGVELQTMIHSGKTRARETAEMLAAWLNPNLLPVAKPGLAPLDDVHEAAARIQRDEGGLMIVGHLPHLVKLTSVVLGVPESLPVVEFKPGSVLCLEDSMLGHPAIHWMFTPELTGRLP
jgi:phosphohistidine phosphatase